MKIQNTHTTTNTGTREWKLETRVVCKHILYFVFRISLENTYATKRPTSSIQHLILNTNIILLSHSFGGLSPPKEANFWV
jgi:hypothetical protein